MRAKIGLEFKADIEELTRDECIEILLALQTRGFEFNDFFIQRGVDNETAKIGGRKEMWFHEHLGAHLDIDMAKGAEERMMEDEAASMIGMFGMEDEEEDGYTRPIKKARLGTQEAKESLDFEEHAENEDGVVAESG